ncbi:DUF3140 domain-containing protein [Antarcticirhabdus aurantiaca]|uniref:DUF3140 domain-containing protein n=1 Tax=Antarcticirhabdus aurantiaca TaxID=2606717 RepID=A0ACD4NUI3_9HYPH|nr:DUF3140 domain-containing protein [Antarcticirhabdus aurantiaca]WAJ30715.1 DUF3140 domain-containing protein [Jeongeuplla avenae]
MTKDHDEIWSEWQELVNMTPAKLETWLKSEESKSVGDTHGEGESTGHKSGRRIIEIKHTKKADLTDDQWAWMNKTTGYIKRHLAQRPKGDIGETDWRYSLMNWGHDPLKEG